MATVTTSKSTGWITPKYVSQYTTNVNSGACYAYSNLSSAKTVDGSYASIPSSGGVNSSHRSPRVYFYGFDWGLPSNGTIEITEVLVRQRVMKNTNQGGIEDYIVSLKHPDSNTNTGWGTNRASAVNWATKSLTYRTYTYTPSEWGLPSLGKSHVNQAGFGCVLQCIGTSSTWAIPAIDGVEMAIRYKHIVTVDPVYSQTQTLSTSSIKVSGQKTNLTIVQKNTNSTAGSFPATTVSLSDGLFFSDGTRSKSIAAVSTASGWSRTTTFNNIYCTKAGTGTITITNSSIGTKTLSVKMLAADQIIYPDPENLKLTVSGDLVDGGVYQPSEKREIQVKVSGKSYTSSSITEVMVDIGNIPYDYVDIINSSNNSKISDISHSDNFLYFNVESNHNDNINGVLFEEIITLKVNIPWIFEQNCIIISDDKEILTNPYLISYDVLIHTINIAEAYKTKISSNHIITLMEGEVFAAVGEKHNILTECGIVIETDDPFIGPLNIETAHSTDGLKNKTTNTLIKKGYKNRMNIGKKGDYREDIPLSVIVPYEDAAVFQGMVDMDKPFPINTVLTSPDMDPFNHRGWVEIYGAELEYLNPLKTKVDLDVEYLSRNLNVPTSVTRQSKLNPTINSSIGDLVLEQFNIDYTNTDSEDPLFIDPETDKPLPYSPTFSIGGEGVVNNDTHTVLLDEDDYYRFKTLNKIPEKYEAEILWKIDFNKTEVDKVLTPVQGYVPPDTITYNVEKSIRLVDSNDNPVFIYTLDNIMYEIERDAETGEIIDEHIYGNVTFHEFYEDGSSNQFTETIELPMGDSNDGYADRYGLSTVTTFIVENDRVVITETGTIAKETTGDPVYQSEPIYLIPLDKYFVLENLNKSDDITTDWDDILGAVPTNFQTLFNITEYNFSSTASNYTNMIVSPFPLVDKPLIFTRRCKEGLLYYYRFDGGNSSSYYVQPNNMYKGGVDLTTEKGTSILTERYSVNPLCMDNGLVRCIFMKNLNRVNIYIFNPSTDESILRDPWIYICSVIVPNMGTVATSSLSDDKITINTGSTSWTLYRGHYSIDIIHNSTDLKFLQKFDKIHWVDPLGDTVEENLFMDTNYPFINSFYHQFYNKNDDEGLMIIRPNKDTISGMSLPRSSKTVLVPYYKNSKIYNRPSSLALEWMYQYGQIIKAEGVG